MPEPSTAQPAYGHERIMLIPTRSKKGAHRLERQVFAENGFSHVWVEDAKDWVTWQGEYVPIETLGHFDDWDSAKQFMIAREAAAAPTEGDGK